MGYIYDVDNDKLWGIDVEGDLIPSTEIYLLCAINLGTRERVALRSYAEMRDWLYARMQEGCFFVAHNGIGYDCPTLNRIVGSQITISRIIDTNVMSQVYNPGIKPPPPMKTKPHSLKAWGHRVGLEKIEFDDFTGWTPEMEEYCFRDVEVCLRTYERLSARMREKGFTETGLALEHKAAFVLSKQKENGCYFDLEEAHHLYNKLREMEKDIEDRVNVFWPPEMCVVFHGAQALKKDGSHTQNFIRHSELYEKVLQTPDGGYDCYDYVYFDVGSPNQRRQKLLDLGWEPREYTKTGLEKLKEKPKPTKEEMKKYAAPTSKGKLSPSLLEFVEDTGNEQVRLITDWLEVNYLGNMVNTWINACSPEDQRIHGSLFLANTLRHKHSDPNTANIPGVKMKKGEDGKEHPLRGAEGGFTYEARALWTHSPGPRAMVGVDAKGIQLRVLSHHLGNEDFTDSILSEDPHSANMEKFKLPSRHLTKTITYALVMGAGDPRISSEARISLKEARASKALFFEKIPEFPELIQRLKLEQNATGRIKLCSGTPLLVPEDRLVIPYLLQGDESQIMKVAMFRIFSMCVKEGIDARQVLYVHDELQYDVLEEHVERFSEICLEAFLWAGRYFNYTLPIEGDVKVGRNWSETH